MPSLASQMPNNTPDAVGRRIADLERTVRELTAVIYLRTGSIVNGALANPVVPQVARASATNFPITQGAYTEVAGLDLVVPPGCTRLLAVVVGFVGVVNVNAADYLNAMVTINTQASMAFATLIGASGFGSASSGDAFTFTGLTPSSLPDLIAGTALRVSVKAAMNSVALPANANTHASVAAQLTWLK